MGGRAQLGLNVGGFHGNRERVPQILNSRVRVVATRLPGKQRSHAFEDVLHRPDGQLPAGARDEERCARARVAESVTDQPVLRQGLHCAWMYRQAPGLAELGLPNGDRRAVQFDVRDLQLQSLRQPEPRSGDQAEQRSIHQRPQATARGQAPGLVKQFPDLFVGVDVRCQPSMAASEDAERRHLGGRLKLPVVGRERSNDLEPPSGGHRTGVPDMLACPA